MSDKKIKYKADPTKTVGLRKDNDTKITKLFLQARKEIIGFLRRDHSVFNKKYYHENITNFEYVLRTQDLARFNKFVDDVLKGRFVDPDLDKNIIISDIARGFDRGVQTARLFGEANLGISQSLYSVLDEQELRRVSNFLLDRAFNLLESVSTEMGKNLNYVLANAVLNGEAITTVAEKITKSINITARRARLIARTEIINSFNRGYVEQVSDIEKITNKEYKYIWITAEDERVRESHKARNNKIYSKKKVLGLLGEPNCRCSINLWSEELK